MSIKNPFILIAALSITAQAGLAQVTGINSTVIQPSTDVTVTVPFTPGAPISAQKKQHKRQHVLTLSYLMKQEIPKPN